jgi:hypothetical protein
MINFWYKGSSIISEDAIEIRRLITDWFDKNEIYYWKGCIRIVR